MSCMYAYCVHAYITSTVCIYYKNMLSAVSTTKLNILIYEGAHDISLFLYYINVGIFICCCVSYLGCVHG